MEKIPVAYRPDFAVAEKSGQPERAQSLLDLAGIVMRVAEQAVAPAVATAEATAIDR